MSRFEHLLPSPGAPEAHLRAGSKKGRVSPAPCSPLVVVCLLVCLVPSNLFDEFLSAFVGHVCLLVVVSLTGVMIYGEAENVNLAARKKSQKSLAMELTTIGNAPMMNLVRTTTERN